MDFLENILEYTQSTLLNKRGMSACARACTLLYMRIRNSFVKTIIPQSGSE